MYSTVQAWAASMKVVVALKPAERRTKKRKHWEEHDDWAGRVKNFQKPAMLKTASLDCEPKAT